MPADQYRRAEDEYFKVRGQFDTGRLTQDQFDEKLRALMVQDEQGRYWMLGADSGKWYFYDGAKWVQGDPYAGAATAAAGVTAESAPAAPASPPAPPSPASPPPTPGARRFPLVPLLVGVSIVVLAIAAFLLLQNRGGLFVAQPPQITPIVPPTITRVPSPTALAVLPTEAQPTLAPFATALPTSTATVPPPVTIIVVTSVPAATQALPTPLPTATNPPTVPPPTRAPATRAPTAVPPTQPPVVNCPYGVCVTDIAISPGAPKRNQNVTFTVTFVNSTNEARGFNWLILLFDPNKSGPNKGFGESPASPLTVPPGTSQATITYVAVNGPGGCVSLYAQAGNKINAQQKDVFPNTNGQPYSAGFDVCP